MTILHVTNGAGTGDTLRQTALGGAVLPWNDVLSEGPVPALPPDELRAVRARFLSTCGWGSAGAILDSLERRDELLTRRPHGAAARRPLVRARPLRPAPAPPDPHVRRGRRSGAHRAPQHRELRGPARLPRARRAERSRAGVALGKRRPVTPELVALAREGWDAVTAPGPPRSWASSGGARPLCPSSRARSAACSRSFRTRRRGLTRGALGARVASRSAADPRPALARVPVARAGALRGRRVVLEAALGAGLGRAAAARTRRRRCRRAASPADRPTRVRGCAACAHDRRPRCSRRGGRPSTCSASTAGWAGRTSSRAASGGATGRPAGSPSNEQRRRWGASDVERCVGLRPTACPDLWDRPFRPTPPGLKER